MGDGYVETVEVYRDHSGDWRWRAKAGNHEIVADSGEGYTTKGGAMEAAKEMFPEVEPTLETSGDPQPTPSHEGAEPEEAEDGEATEEAEDGEEDDAEEAEEADKTEALA